MTISEEIQHAMNHGASAMFLYGLLAYFRRDPVATMQAIEMAAERSRGLKEVKLSDAEQLWQGRLKGSGIGKR